MKTIWQKNKELTLKVERLEFEQKEDKGTIEDLRYLVDLYYKQSKQIEIERIMRNGKATIVWFADGEKVVVKKCATDKPSIYSAVAFAIIKRLYGNNSHFQSVVDGFVKKNK